MILLSLMITSKTILIRINKSLSKYLTFVDNPSDKGARRGLIERRMADQRNSEVKTGGFIAYCSKCGNKEFPENNFQIKEGSYCCKVEYLPELGYLDD